MKRLHLSMTAHIQNICHISWAVKDRRLSYLPCPWLILKFNGCLERCMISVNASF